MEAGTGHNIHTYLLLENKGRGKDSPQFVEAIEGLPYGAVAIGSHLEANEMIQGYQEESLSDLNSHVRYVHTKFLLIDPLGEHPIVVTGSANFSAASTTNNDENMLILYGEAARSVAHVYLTEFMRLFDHFSWRQKLVQRAQKKSGITMGKAKPLTPKEKAAVEQSAGSVLGELAEDDTWLRNACAPGSKEAIMRSYFMRGQAGALANMWQEEQLATLEALSAEERAESL